LKTAETHLEGLRVLEPDVHADGRGLFFESYNERSFSEIAGQPMAFVQDNQSRSAEGVLRGLHYQLPPMAQGKLVRAVRGSILDVAVDIRRSSPTFGQWFAIELTEQNRKQLWVPPGFAHGFRAMTDGAEIMYKVTEYYSPECDRSIQWNDPDVGIDWMIGDGEPILSDKDAAAPPLSEAEIFE